MKNKIVIGTKQAGTTNIDIQKEHRSVLAAPMTNTFYVNDGKCFNVTQAANLMQGRSVYRDDLVNQGRQYSAWTQMNFEKPRDKYDNFQLKSYNESYNFDLKESLSRFKIAELSDPAKLEKIMAEMKNGNRPVVTATSADGQTDKFRIQAVPQFRSIDFSNLDGGRVKREGFEKELKLDSSLSISQNQQQFQSQGMPM